MSIQITFRGNLITSSFGKSDMGKVQKFIFLAGCIFVSFFLFSLAQEKITKTVYVNPDGSVEYFTYSTTIVFIYCLVNYLLTLICLRFIREEDSTPVLLHCGASFVYFLAMICSNLALQFINYPTQVIAKSCKPIPVMVFGVLLGKRSYSFKKYIFVGLVVFGVITFLYKDVKDDKKKLIKSEGTWVGELLVLSSLFMDGIISAMQERMRGDYQTKPLCMMLNLNKWATVFGAVFLIITSEIFKFFLFAQRHPAVLWKLCILSICGFFGQLSVINTVVEFGTLPVSIITTVRKFFTAVTSVLLLGNTLLPRQWVAALIIFSGLFLDILYGKSDTKVK